MQRVPQKRNLCQSVNSSTILEQARCVKAAATLEEMFVHLNKCLYRQHKYLVLFRCGVKVAKPETFPKGPHAAMGVRGPPGEDPGRSSAAAENMEAVARADGMGRRQTAEPCNAT